MEKVFKWLQNSFVQKTNEIFSIPALAAVSGGMQKTVPFILSGSVVFFYNVFRSYIPSLPDISPIASYSFGLIGLLVSYFIAQQLLEKLDLSAYAQNIGLLSMVTLMMISLEPYEGELALNNFFKVSGPNGILLGMLVGLFVGGVFYVYKKLRFLEDSVNVPEFVISWLDTIIPTLIVLLIAMIVVHVFKVDLFQIIHSLFMPFFSFGQSLPGMIFCVFVPVFFYTLGVSTWFWGAFTGPIFMAGIQANIDAAASGIAVTNIVTNEICISSGLVSVGGAGCTMILVILMLFSKSKTLRLKGKIFIGPAIFNINEPVVFGAPVILNPILMVPMWLCALVGPIVLWFVFKFGWLNIPSAIMQIGQIPAPFSAWIVTQDLRAFLWFAVLIVLYFIIWYPFFKVFERMVLEEESNGS
ncbi:MAG: PTS transporter subunit EIIC [Hungatella sp.]|jgi:PTS system cellobiose-specific IIC component|nr:PTS transporter subunit EIIC [Hungatella sp.]